MNKYQFWPNDSIFSHYVFDICALVVHDCAGVSLHTMTRMNKQNKDDPKVILMLVFKSFTHPKKRSPSIHPTNETLKPLIHSAFNQCIHSFIHRTIQQTFH